MIYTFVYYLYLLTLLFASFCGVYQFKRLDTASRILSILVCCALINEVAAYYIAKKYHDNLPLYTIYCLIEFSLLCLYFNYMIDIFLKKHVGIYIAAIGVAIGILNIAYVQKLDALNSYFLFFEGWSVIGMSLFAFFRLLLTRDSLHLHQYAHFWFISILIFFWSITFLTWGLYDYINMKLQHEAWEINCALFVMGTITYGSFGAVFLFYPKMKFINE